jgi:hypothetical protein
MPESIEVSLDASKEMYELLDGLVAFLKVAKTAASDGWSMGDDLPVVLTAAMGSLIPALQGIEKVGSELKEEPAQFIAAIAAIIPDIADLFLAKKEVE